MLIEGDKVAFAPKDINDWPKDFFEVLVRSDWRKWVEAVKKEIEGWDDNRAVELVNIEDVVEILACTGNILSGTELG